MQDGKTGLEEFLMHNIRNTRDYAYFPLRIKPTIDFIKTANILRKKKRTGGFSKLGIITPQLIDTFH